MKAWMWAVVGVAVLVTIVVSWQAYRCQAKTDRCTAAQAAYVSVSAGDANGISTVEKEKSANQAARSCADVNSYLCRVLTPANLPTIYLVILGVGGIVVGIGTLITIEKQTDATVKSERAWIMVDLEKVPGIGIVTNMASQERGGQQRYFRYLNTRCICTNQGQTAARIIEKRCAAVVINGDDELPESPNLDIEIKDPIPHYLRANGDPWHGDWNTEAEAADSENVKLIIIYGVVRYRHLFSSKIAQTTFGYSLSFSGTLKRLIGKPKYNENT